MNRKNKINVAVVGLNFGTCFAAVYKEHPDVGEVIICDRNEELLRKEGDALGVKRRYTDLKEVLACDDIDAVHLLTDVAGHAPLALAVLKAGKHCACAVPMATSIADLNSIISEQERSGKNYMMMETVVYSSDYMYARDLYRDGVFGKIQFMRGCHSQDLEGINPVWRGFPPMWYMTHAVSPLLDILNTRAIAVHCYGSGVMREEFKKNYGNPYPIETAIFKLEGTETKAEITRTLFETASYGGEAFDIYGEKATLAFIGVEAPYRRHGDEESKPLLLKISPLLKTGENRTFKGSEVDIPFRPELLPEPLRKFALGGHGGSHPHLAHEFVRSIVEKREPYVNARRAADWCAAGICAHESAMKDGALVEIPAF